MAADNKIYQYTAISADNLHDESLPSMTHSKVESGEIMMQEKLSRHDEEGEIMEEPSQE